MDESSPAPAAPGRPEGSRLPHEPESRRRVRSDRTRRLGAFLFLAQGPIVTFTPVWTLGVFFMGLTRRSCGRSRPWRLAAPMCGA